MTSENVLLSDSSVQWLKVRFHRQWGLRSDCLRKKLGAYRRLRNNNNNNSIFKLSVHFILINVCSLMWTPQQARLDIMILILASNVKRLWAKLYGWARRGEYPWSIRIFGPAPIV